MFERLSLREDFYRRLHAGGLRNERRASGTGHDSRGGANDDGNAALDCRTRSGGVRECRAETVPGVGKLPTHGSDHRRRGGFEVLAGALGISNALQLQ